MPTELLCCMGIIVWILVGLFFWAVCAVGGMADDVMEFHLQNEGVGFGSPDDEWLPGEKARIVGYENGVPIVKFRDEA